MKTLRVPCNKFVYETWRWTAFDMSMELNAVFSMCRLERMIALAKNLKLENHIKYLESSLSKHFNNQD